MISKIDIISIYKRLSRTINGIPNSSKRDSYMKKFKKEFKKNMNETDPKKIESLYEYAQSKLGFLEVVSNYKPRKVPIERYVVKDGEIIEGESEKRRAHFKDQRIDPDDMARHQRLLRRQHFQDRHMPLRWGGE